MKKNLKKVISAVIALALSVSSVAMAAPKFTDVADTAANAQAINTLAALGVISGYEDGTFKPDNNITRAEVATMIVAALNRTADAAGAKGTTKFADVNTEAKAWASGFVNIGVAEKYISGYEDGTFRPDNNVTYAEIVSMLVRMVGYGQYAEYLGGWPNGYLSVGSDKGITAGVSAAQDAAVTRAQVAQMIYNSIVDVCKVSSSGFTTTTDGKLVPSLTIMDGTQNNSRVAKDYQTILTDNFDAYYVEGFVSETARTDGLNTYKADEVQFTIRYAENYNDDSYLTKEQAKKNIANGVADWTEKVKVGNTDAVNYLNTYASAIIKVDDDDATIVSFIPSGKNNTVKFSTTLYEEDTIAWTAAGATDVQSETASISFNQTKDASKPTKYNLNTTGSGTSKTVAVDMYVNGKEVNFNKANYDKYIVNNTAGEVELIDRYDVDGSADNKFDIINVSYYATAKISQINLSNSGRVTFNKIAGATSTYINLDEEDEDLAFEIFYNGEKVEPSALQVDDVLSIEYDVTATNLAESGFYTIYVSRDTAEGKYTGENTGDETFTIGGKDYEYVEGFSKGSSDLNLSYEYTVWLDAFGRIFDTQVLTSAARYAVVDKYYKRNSGDDNYSVLLYTMDGTTKTAEVDLNASGVKANFPTDNDIRALVYEDTDGSSVIEADEMTTVNKTPIQDRVVSYKISSSTGKVTSLEPQAIKGQAAHDTSTYKASKMTLGTIKMNDATKIIDATDYEEGTSEATYSNLSVTGPSALTDDNGYDAFCFGDINKSDKTYPLVIVTGAGGAYTSETMFAVLTEKAGNAADEATGDEYSKAKAFYGNEEVELKFDTDTKGYDATGAAFSYEDLQKGDVIVFSKGANDYIKTFDIIATAESLGIDEATLKGSSDQSKTFMNTAYAQTALLFGTSRASEFNNWTGKWVNGGSGALSDSGEVDYSKEVTRIVYGPVIEASSTGFTLGSIGTATDVPVTAYNDSVTMPATYSGLFTDTSAASGVKGFTMDVDADATTNVYTYDFSYGLTSSKRMTAGGVVSTGATDYYTANTGKFYPWSNGDYNKEIRNNVTFALVRMVDGEARDVLLIMPTNVK